MERVAAAVNQLNDAIKTTLASWNFYCRSRFQAEGTNRSDIRNIKFRELPVIREVQKNFIAADFSGQEIVAAWLPLPCGICSCSRFLARFAF